MQKPANDTNTVCNKHFALQGVQYDDDEGYEDTLDDGGDEGPTY